MTAALHSLLWTIKQHNKTRLPKVILEQAALPTIPRPTPCTTPNRSNNWSRTFAQLQWGAPHLPQKLPPPVDQSQNPTTCPSLDPPDLPSPNRIHIRPISRFATMHWTDRRTHRPTDGWWECSMITGHFCSIESDAA